MNRKLVTLASILAALLVGCSSGDHQNDPNMAATSSDQSMQTSAPASDQPVVVPATPSADSNAQASMPAAPGTADTTTTPAIPAPSDSSQAPIMQPNMSAPTTAPQDPNQTMVPPPATIQTAPVTTAPATTPAQ